MIAILRLAAVAFVAALLGWSTSASAAPTQAILAHGYHAPHSVDGANAAQSERGLPLADARSIVRASQPIVDLRSVGGSACQDIALIHAYADRDRLAPPAQIDQSVGGVFAGDLSVLRSSPIAAETGTVAGEQATIHGAERLTQAGFDEATVSATKAGRVLQQADGATVYVNEVSPGKYDFIIQGERGVVTAHRGWSFKSVTRLAGNYGWQGWP